MLKELIPKVDKAEHREWIKQITLWNIEHPTVVREANGKMNPQEIIEYLCSHTDKETIFVTDVGQHQMWAAQYVKQTGPRNFISSGGLGTMGFGYGAAIGAQQQSRQEGHPSDRRRFFPHEPQRSMHSRIQQPADNHRDI